MDWNVPANSKIYNHADSFQIHGYIDWIMKASYHIGDIMYIYCTKPYQKIMYKAVVEKIDLSFTEKTDDKEFWLEQSNHEQGEGGKFARLRLISQVNTEKLSAVHLLAHGMPGIPQRPFRSNEALSQYINENMNDYYSEGLFQDIDEGGDSYNENHNEGLTKRVLVNKYERSSKARGKCIEYYGCKCYICGMDFAQEYGAIGEGFIHVHHKIPISEIKKEYIINYKNDLIPICPNCHAMLHRKINGEYLTIDKLIEVIKEKMKINE